MRPIRLAVLVAFAACTPFAAAEDSTGGGGDGGDAGVPPDAQSDSATGVVDGGPPKANDMIVISSTAGKYAIDAREVTNTAFAKFVAAAASSPPTGLAQCTWKTTWGTTAAACAENPDHPVRCIDWCDAKAYCLSVGKRLCGKIGGGSLSIGDSDDAAKSQWTRACAGTGSVFVWAYGATAVNGRCNTSESNIRDPVQSGSLMDCFGSELGLFDMSGNVGEWEDACELTAGSSANCLIRGGSFEHVVSDTRCDQGLLGTMSETRFEDVGIRCCKDNP
jgi:formylglycine-generating enzyme